MVWSFIHHYTSAIQLRSSLYLEVLKAKANNNTLPQGINRKIWKEPHNHEEYIWLLRFIPNDQNVRLIDIGGNSGYWAEEFLRYYPKSKIYAFEPIEDMFLQYAKRFLGRENIKVFNTALGDTVEQKQINVAKGYGLTSFNTYSESLEDRNVNFEKQLNVSVEKLDNYFARMEFTDPMKTIVKVDVQGFETKVVRGGMDVFSEVDLAIIECSFINEFKGELPTFGDLVALLRQSDLHPIRFGVFDRSRSQIPYERNVLFVRSNYFAKIWH